MDFLSDPILCTKTCLEHRRYFIWYLQNECKASNYLFILFNYEENHTRNKKPEKSAAPYFLPLYLDSTCKGLRPSSTCPSHLIMKSSSWLCSTKFVTNHVVAVCEAKIAPQTAVTSGRSNSCWSCRQSQLLLSYFPLYSCKLWKPVFPKLLKYQYFNENLFWHLVLEESIFQCRPPHHNLQYLVLCLCEYELSGLELRLIMENVWVSDLWQQIWIPAETKVGRYHDHERCCQITDSGPGIQQRTVFHWVYFLHGEFLLSWALGRVWCLWEKQEMGAVPSPQYQWE